MKIFIEPLDVLFFRDGRPFTAGEQHLAQSIFPPTSLTFQGAIRANILKQTGILTSPHRLKSFWQGTDEICDIIGSSQDYGKLRIMGPFIAKKEGDNIVEYFVTPSDIVRTKESGKLHMLRPLKEDLFISDITQDFKGIRPLWVRKKENLKRIPGYISKVDLERYLLDAISDIQVVHEDSFLARDSRLGITLQDGIKISKEGLLYIAEFLKLKEKWGFTLDVHLENGEGLEKYLPESGFFYLGGERRAVFYFKIKEGNWLDLRENIKEKVGKKKRFKLIFLTPAYLDQGWYATWMENGEKGEVKFKWVSACVRNFISIGGWNIAKRYPRPMGRFIPPGSVYYFELEKGLDGLFKEFWLRPISEKYREIGFGLTLIGYWDYT